LILAYADDIVILGNTRQDITQTMSNLVTASKRMGLCINEEKTKFMVLSRRREDQPNLQIDNFTFESVENFKYLGVNINNKNDMHQEIVERLASGNRCYHSIQKLLKSKLPSRRSKTPVHIVRIIESSSWIMESWQFVHSVDIVTSIEYWSNWTKIMINSDKTFINDYTDCKLIQHYNVMTVGKESTEGKTQPSRSKDWTVLYIISIINF